MTSSAGGGLRVLFMVTRDAHNPAAAGGDVQCWEFARYLAAAGHQVTYLTSAFPGGAREEWLDGIHVVRLGGILSLWWRTCLHYLRHCRGRYDVVVEEGFGGSRIPRFAPLYVREPIVTEWHQVHHDLFTAQYPRPMVPLLDLSERFTAHLHRHTLVRAGTEEWRDAFVRLGFRREKVFVVPVSVREEWLGPLPRGQRGPEIVWIGKFRRYKCPHHLLEALPRVLERVPEARLMLAGRHHDRGYEARLAALARRLGVEGRVRFRFDLTEREKRELLLQARVLALPSAVEGFGIVVLEAGACGVPVVASSGVPEGAVAHGYNGLRYPFGDCHALAEALVRALTDDALHQRLAANARAFAEGHAWGRVGARFEEAVRRAAARGERPELVTA